MHTRLLTGNRQRDGEALIILSTTTDLDWVDRHFGPVTHTSAEQAAKADITYLHRIVHERHHFIAFVGAESDTAEQREDHRLAGAKLLEQLKHYRLTKVALQCELPDAQALVDFAEGLLLAAYQYTPYLSQEKRGKLYRIDQLRFSKGAVTLDALQALEAKVAATYAARDLVNTPPADKTATKMAKQFEAYGAEHGFKVRVLDKKAIQKLKMGGVLAVNKGSNEPPTFSILEYKPRKAVNKKPIVLVGKGVTYDTGGINIKTRGLGYMKSDMGGGAAVCGAFIAAAKAKLPVHIVGLVPASDNRPGVDAYLPSDVITISDGTTVEIINTDAEGRLLLADALVYAKQYKPQLVIDLATLTGSAAVAIGPEGLPYMGNGPDEAARQLEAAGEATYERLVRFPIWREYGQHMESQIADIKNLGKPHAGLISAGKFLEHFTDYPWFHFDIAGPSYMHQAEGYRTREGTGVGVRMLFEFLKMQA